MIPFPPGTDSTHTGRHKMNLKEALTQASGRIGGETAALEAQVLLAHLLSRTRTWILAHLEVDLTAAQVQAMQQALARLGMGDPLPYVLGHWEFFGLEFGLSPHVLIPRPETELLVEQAIAWLQVHPGRRSVLEIGTGSGCIAISIARHIHDAEFIASDVSFEALTLARDNARRHQVAEQITFLQADLFSAFPASGPYAHGFGLICSNPPYIPTAVLQGLKVFPHEPVRALDGGPGGLSTISRLLEGARNLLGEPGLLLIEIDSSQGRRARSKARNLFPAERIDVHRDLSGRDRLLSISR